MARKKNKRVYPTEENPRYGQRFKVIGVQVENIDNELTEMIDLVVLDETKTDLEGNQLPKYMKMAEDWSKWRVQKEKLSDLICKSMNKAGISTPWKDIVSFRIQYFGESTPQVV